jgi:hypothetical protein
MTLVRRLCVVGAAAAVALPAAVATAAGPTSTQTTPKVLHIVTTGYDIQLTPLQVGAPAVYTVQVHNIGMYPVRFTMDGVFTVLVSVGGWKFRDVLFKPGKTYNVHAVAPTGHLSWNAVVTTTAA